MKKLDNYKKILGKLDKGIKDYFPTENDFIISGLISHYNLTFELSWKLLREILIDEGFDKSFLNTPRNVLKTAYESNYIENEELWIEMLRARNETTHIYDEERVDDLINRIISDYLLEFKILLNKIESKKFSKENLDQYF